MSDLNEKFLDTFPIWLRSLGEDVDAVLSVAESQGLDDDVRRQLVAGVNYLFKSLDLIPDGIDDIGYMDDAFVLRVSARLIADSDLSAAGDEKAAIIASLNEGSNLIQEFLAPEIFERFLNYTKELRTSSARGRSVDDVVTQPDVWREFASEVRNFAKSYESPTFSREEKNLIKLKAFFDAKLPR